MLWIKDGKLFNGRIEIDGKIAFVAGDPDPTLMRRLGWEEYTPPAPEPAFGGPDFALVKATFWRYVDEAAAELSAASGATYTRADFPAGAYSADLLAWCSEHGIASDTLAVKFCGIAADLARLGRNWNELFGEDADGE